MQNPTRKFDLKGKPLYTTTHLKIQSDLFQSHGNSDQNMLTLLINAAKYGKLALSQNECVNNQNYHEQDKELSNIHSRSHNILYIICPLDWDMDGVPLQVHNMRSVFNQYGSPLITAWICNKMACKVWNEITYLIPILNSTTVKNTG